MYHGLIICLIFIIQKYLIFSEETDFICPRNTPLLVINSANNDCVYETYNRDVHKISNEIINIQWLNKMNELGVIKTWYIASDFNSKGDLIIQSFIYEDDKIFQERYFYGIQSNGRPLFYDQENNKFNIQITILSTSLFPKFESEFIRIKLTNDDDKDYYLTSSFGN